jgi:hypothetical protein
VTFRADFSFFSQQYAGNQSLASKPHIRTVGLLSTAALTFSPGSDFRGFRVFRGELPSLPSFAFVDFFSRPLARFIAIYPNLSRWKPVFHRAKSG